ncbi:MAG: hypothetical protein JWO13_2062 [Acidobacteriales bacterium]|nr:hypothetical protein [Terriglobales bacterium]
MRLLNRTLTALIFLTSAALADVTVTSPANNSTVSTSTRVVASAVPTSSYRISAMQMYVNSTKVFQTLTASLDTTITLQAGSNRVQVKAWDTGGHYFEKLLTLTANTTASTNPSGVTLVSNIDEKLNWFSCDSCAGANATGPSSTYWMKQNQATPSLDGKSTQFFLGGTTPYANALWSQHVITDSAKTRAAKHFIYDIYMYYTNPSASQGLEFNVSQFFDDKAYIYGMQCNIRSGSGPHWDISTVRDTTQSPTLGNMKWQNTGIACPAPPAYTWNHITMEVERTSDNKVHFISISINDKKSYLNLYAPMRIAPTGWMGVNVHYQMNGDYKQDDYSTWVDKFSVTYN